MLKVEKLTKQFKSGDTTVTAVNDVTLTVPQGTFASIIGRSGSGKSTLLSLLGALDRPNSGTIEVDGQDIAKMSERSQVRYRCQKIGFVFQNYNLIPNLTARENVMIALEFNGRSMAEQKTRAEELLNEVGLTADKQQRRPGRLSGGEQQRVAIARALANRPTLILADEPTGNLDSQTGKMIFDLLHRLAKSQKTTIIAVTHDLSIAGKTELTFELKDGKLVAKTK
jgi:putative ABC transport system ATP-binding protein